MMTCVPDLHDARATGPITPLDVENAPPAHDVAIVAPPVDVVYVRTPLQQRYTVPRAALAYSPFLSMQHDFDPTLQEVDVAAMLGADGADGTVHTLARMPDHFYARLCRFLHYYMEDGGAMPAIPTRCTTLPPATVFRRHRYWPLVADLTVLEVGRFDQFALFMGLDDLRYLNEARVAVLLHEHRASLHRYLPYFQSFIERDVQLQQMRAMKRRRTSPRLLRSPTAATAR